MFGENKVMLYSLKFGIPFKNESKIPLNEFVEMKVIGTFWASGVYNQ